MSSEVQPLGEMPLASASINKREKNAVYELQEFAKEYGIRVMFEIRRIGTPQRKQVSIRLVKWFRLNCFICKVKLRTTPSRFNSYM